MVMFFMSLGGVVFCEENNAKNVEFEELHFDSVCFPQGKGHDLGEIIINNDEEYKVLLKLKPDDRSSACTHTYDTSDGGLGYRHCKSVKDNVFELSKKCSNIDLPKIDFSQKTLLGKFSMTFDLSANYFREVTKDDLRKEMIYSIKILESNPPVESCRTGCRYLANLNLVVIPKIPQGYKVVFKLTGGAHLLTPEDHFNGGGMMTPLGH